VLLAGTVVIIAVLGMFTVGLAIIRGLALGISIGVFSTMVASVTLLPPLFGFVGTNIDRLAVPGMAKPSQRQNTRWRHWSERVQRRPWVAIGAGAGLLLVLALPAVALRQGFGDSGNGPRSDTTRRAYDIVSKGFGPGANGPLIIAAALPNGPADFEVLQTVSDQLNHMPASVYWATPPLLNDVGDAAVMQVFPAQSPQSAATQKLVHTIRHQVIPQQLNGSGMTAYVGGETAADVDFSEFMGARLPVFTLAVLLVSFLLLMVMFRSVLVPLKAVVLNLLALGACYGVLVAVFQWGWGDHFLGVGRAGPIDAWVPMMLFAVIFGLSMDYEVFLLSRIREAYDRTGDNSEAVATGVSNTARVITAGAAVMFCVFGAFVLGSFRGLKIFGLGLAVAVLLDATVVRLVLVPATMELLGDRNWWLPPWLDRWLPQRRPAGEAAAPAPAADEPEPVTVPSG